SHQETATTESFSAVPFKIGGTPAVLTRKNVYGMDGTSICPSSFYFWGDYTVVVENGQFFIPNSGGGAGRPTFEAYELPSAANGEPKIKKSWTLSPEQMFGECVHDSYTVASPLIIDGLFYSINGYGQMHVVDVRAKSLVYRQWLDGYHR